MAKIEHEPIGEKDSLAVVTWAWVILIGLLAGSAFLGLKLGGI